MRANASETRARKMIGKPWRVHGHVAGAPAQRGARRTRDADAEWTRGDIKHRFARSRRRGRSRNDDVVGAVARGF